MARVHRHVRYRDHSRQPQTVPYRISVTASAPMKQSRNLRPDCFLDRTRHVRHFVLLIPALPNPSRLLKRFVSTLLGEWMDKGLRKIGT